MKKYVSRLQRLNAGLVKEFLDPIQKRVNRQYINEVVITEEGNAGFPRRLENEVQKVEGDIQVAQREMQHQITKMVKWKRRPFPGEVN